MQLSTKILTFATINKHIVGLIYIIYIICKFLACKLRER